MHTFLKTILLSFVLLAPAACGDDEFTASGADLLEEWAEALCAAGSDCGTIPPGDVDLCVDAFVQAACEEDPAVCRERYTLSSSEWNDCLDASRDLDCAALDPIVIPSECSTIEELQ